MALAITKENFQEVLSSELPVVIDFWAEWCGPCRMVAPIVDELATEYEGRVLIAKCDVEENDEITAKYGVRNIPTIIFLKGGELVDKQVGAASKDALVAKIEKLLEDAAQHSVAWNAGRGVFERGLRGPAGSGHGRQPRAAGRHAARHRNPACTRRG